MQVILTEACGCTINSRMKNSVFILGRDIAGIPHFHKKSPKLSGAVRDKSHTLSHAAVLFYDLVIYCITLLSPTFFENAPHFFKAWGQIPHFFQILK